MKKFKWLVALTLSTLTVTLFSGCSSCDIGETGQTSDSTADADNIASISVSGQQTQFYLGDTFSTGEMVVTVVYEDASTKDLQENEYTVDSTAYVATELGNYSITVSMNDTPFATSYSVVVSERSYAVTADEGISILSGVTNGRTEQEETITFSALADMGHHINAVKVNDTLIEPIEGIYSFAAADYLISNDATIAITLEQEEHSYAMQTVAPSCVSGYTQYLCSCGDYMRTAEIDARSLVANVARWTGNMTFTEEETGVKLTQTGNDTWGEVKRTVNVDTTTDGYLVINTVDVTANTTVLVQFGELTKKTLVAGRNVLALSNMDITQSGEYTLRLFIEGTKNVASVMLNEVSFVSQATDTVHTYDAATDVSASCHTVGYEEKACLTCGIRHREITEEAKFLFADRSLWTSTITLEYVDNTGKFTINTGTWGVATRTVTLKTTDYIRFTATGTFKVELQKAGSAAVVIIDEQEMNGTPFVLPVNSVVTEDGEYTLKVYAVGAVGSVHTVTECFVLENAQENVHICDRTGQCTICGVQVFDIPEGMILVDYILNGGTNASTNPETYKAGDNASLADPIKKGYNFLGWFNANDDRITTLEGQTEHLTLTAKWEKAIYTITYAGLEGATNPNTATSYTVDTVTIILQNPEREGYIFNGWYIGDTKVTEIPQGSTGNITLTAEWFDEDGGTWSPEIPL